MNNVRLVCNGSNLDLPTDFGILINKSIADVRNPDERSGDWSKTFTLPGSKTNNKLFTHLFDLNLSIRNTTAGNFAPDFNPNLKAPATLFVDEVVQIQGFIRLLNINVTDRHQIEYECSMHGVFSDLFTSMAEGKLADLDFTEYNHTINSTNIFNSWDTSIIKNGSAVTNFSGGAPTGEGYTYTWIDNGEYWVYDKMYTDDMNVCLYAKTVVDKIFSGAGYNYSSGSFFNSSQFKRLVIPCQTKTPVLTEAQVSNRLFEASRASSGTFTIGQKITFPTEISDPSNQYDTSTSVFTAGLAGRYSFAFVSKATITGLSGNGLYNIHYGLYVNGVRKAVFGVIGTAANILGTVTVDNTTYTMQDVRMNQNDTAEIRLDAIEDPVNWQYVTSGYTYTQNADSKWFNEIIESSYGYNDTMDFGGFFTDETKQRDFMKWLFVAFNLYAEPDPDNVKTLVVKPRDDFYQNTVRDWTAKRDLSQPLQIIPMGELDANRYRFTYAEGDDEGNKVYKADFNREYGDRQLAVVNDFLKEEKRIEVGFAPTLLNKFPNNDKVLSYIDNGDSKEKRFFTGKLRLLQFAALNCNSYTIYNGTGGSTTTTTKTKYPFTTHIDHPTASTTDINFGLSRFIGLPPGTAITNNNLYNAYWRKYMAEITDKDSKIVRGSFYLTPADMERLSFQDLYFFDGNYFRLNKIEDYDPVNPSVNICEFLFLKTGQSFTATTGSVGGGGVNDGGSGEQEYDPGGGGTSFKVIQQRGVSIGEYNSVGDGIGVGTAINNLGARNAAFATSGVTFSGVDSIVVGEAPANPVGDNEVWLQGHQMTQLNFSTNRIATTTATSVNADLYKDIYIMTLTAATTLNLPQASTATGKAYYVFKNTSSHSLRIEPYGDELIDGTDHFNLTNHYECVQIVCDGTAWYVISKK